MLLVTTLAGCGSTCGRLAFWTSQCESLCCETADAMASCIDQDGAFTWADVDATGRDDFLRTCFADWDDTSRLLTAFEQQEATRVCLETSDALDAQADRCALLQSLYAP